MCVYTWACLWTDVLPKQAEPSDNAAGFEEVRHHVEVGLYRRAAMVAQSLDGLWPCPMLVVQECRREQ
eukprot:6123596-Lingulodinium_polyedra.AAC.1